MTSYPDIGNASVLQQQIDELIALYDQGNFQQVLKLGEKLIEQHPSTEIIFKVLAATNASLGHLEQAVAYYTQVLQFDSDNAIAHSNLGVVLSKLGRNEEAIASYEKSLAIDPDDAETHNNLASAFKFVGKLKEASQSVAKAIQIKPDYAEAYNNWGATLGILGRHEEALVNLAKAIKLKPDYAEAHNNLGVTLTCLSRCEEAIANHTKAIEIRPDYVAAHTSLSEALRITGRFDEAINSCQKALLITPDYVDAHICISRTFRDLGKFKNAMASIAQALTVQPDNVEAHTNMGLVLNQLSRYEEATASLTRALEIQPDYAKAHNLLGIILQSLGKSEEAAASINKALEFEPKFAEAHFNLSRSKVYTLGDPHIEQMQLLLKDMPDTSRERVVLNFSISKAYDDLGLTKKAFESLSEGNLLLKKERGYNVKPHKLLFERIKSHFHSTTTVPEKEISGNQKALKPIFIVGMPRSGTTLVEQILASHSLVHGAGELTDLSTIVQKYFLYTKSVTDNLANQNSWHLLRSEYFSELEELNVQETIITEKISLNFRWIGYIATAFPEAKIVNLNRDPMATCWSIYRHYFDGRGNDYAYDLTDVAEFYNMYAGLMSFWREKFPNKIYDQYYEDLTENQERETRKLLDFCELGWENQCLDFHKTDRVVKTSSMHQVRKKLYTGSSESWKKYKKFLGPMMDALNI